MAGEVHADSQPGRAVRLIACGFALIAAWACAADGGPAADSDLLSEWQYARLDSSEVSQIQLGEGQLIPLGTGGEDSPAKISRVTVSADAIYVLDGDKSSVRRYDRDGVAQYAVGRESNGPVQLRRPYEFVARNDSLWVVSMNWLYGVTLIDPRGEILSQVQVPVTSSLGGISVSEKGVVLSSFFVRGAEDGTARAVTSLAADGTVLGRGCHPDPIYARSARSGGFYTLIGSTSATVLDSLIYCRQALTPIVHVLRLDGSPFAAIRIAPPFYRRGADVPYSLNQLDANRFAATFTEHVAFFPFPNGFLSVYGIYNPRESVREYPIFWCRQWQSPERSCAIASTIEQPVAFLPPDTLVTVAMDKNGNPAVRLVPLR